MRKYKGISIIFAILSLIISHTMVIVVARNYANIQCWIQHEGFSGNTSIAFALGIPYLVGLIVCILVSIIFYRKSKKTGGS